MAKIATTLNVSSPLARSRRLLMVGLASAAVLFGGFGTWAAVAPLASTVIGSGRIVVTSSRQTIQHLEGGIIRAILVRDGDEVVAGQPLIELDDTQAKASHLLLTQQYLAALAQKARLTAELADAEEIAFPAELSGPGLSPQAAEFVDSQRREFAQRRTFLDNQRAIRDNRTVQIDAEIEALKARAGASEEQYELLLDEAKTVQALVEAGNQTRIRYNQLLREGAEARGERDQARAQMAQGEQRKIEAHGQFIDLQNRMRNEAANGLNSVEIQLSDLGQRLAVAADVLARATIRAPLDGVILNLRYKSNRGVIGPGQPVLDIVPTDEPLLIEAQFSPRDVELLRVGAPTAVLLSAYSQRRLPRIDGTLTWVSADALANDSGGQFFLGHIEVDRDRVAALDPTIRLLPGMPADVMVLDHERTLLEYLVNPLFMFAEKAGRES